MAQVQLDSFTLSIPVADSPSSTQGIGPTKAFLNLDNHDDNLNGVMKKYRLQGYDLFSVVYVPAGPIAPHFQLFFVRQ